MLFLESTRTEAGKQGRSPILQPLKHSICRNRLTTSMPLGTARRGGVTLRNLLC
jgi:hypothetical protein